MKNIISLALFIFFGVSVFAQTQWKVDPYHSSLNFNISHSGISIVNGKFMEYTGNLTTDGEALKGANVNFTVKVNSINTNVEDRDNHLRSADFFDVKKFPTMTFKSTKIVATDKPDSYLLKFRTFFYVFHHQRCTLADYFIFYSISDFYAFHFRYAAFSV